MKLFSFLRYHFSRGSTAGIIARFLSDPAHRWIIEDKVFYGSFMEFLSVFPQEHLEEIFFRRGLLLLSCNQNMSCNFRLSRGREVVLVFPELRNLMLSAAREQAYAILAHEFGHIYFRHSKRKISPMLAQLEADQYAVQRGFGGALHASLREEAHSEEVSERLAMLRNAA